MELIGRENHQKLYVQLYEIIRKKIDTKEWPVGFQVPTEDKLCKMYNVSMATVRNAVLELVRQGYMKRQQGKGTFILRNFVPNGLAMHTNFRELNFQEDLPLSTTALARMVTLPGDGIDVKLDIPKDKYIIYIKRLHHSKDEPVMIQESYVPCHVCPLLLEEDVEHQSILDLFENKYGIKITKVKTYTEITYLKSDEARLMRCPDGTAAVLLKEYFYSGEHTVMYVRSVKRPDSFNLCMELERKAS
jgi:DNA-binding GntR family transcriptional regulator